MFLLTLTLGGFLSAPQVVSAQGIGFAPVEKAEVEVFADHASYASGTQARAVALMTIEHGWHTNSHEPTYDYLIPTELEVGVPDDWPEPTVTYPPGQMGVFSFAEEPLSVYEGEALIYVDLAVPEGATDTVVLPISLTYQACDDKSCLAPVTTTTELALNLSGAGEAQNVAFFDRAPSASGSFEAPAGTRRVSLLWMLLFGWIGGLILNAMPCVLPVLSLKVFALIRDSDQGNAVVRRGSFATALGILMSFWALAAVAIGARSAGQAVGWGVQFQEPVFVAVLGVIVVLFCLNLWGLFEIVLPAGMMTRLGGQQNQHGLGGHFASGLFTTLMATPCSAPFLGTAVGFALAQPPLTVLAIFTAVGLGMAFPYVLLIVAPKLARFLPKPGAWMEQLKIAMGFLLAGAAVWLFYVLANQVSRSTLAAFQLSLLALAAAIWLRRHLRGVARTATAVVAVLAIATGLVLTSTGGAPVEASETAHLIDWQPFDQAEIDKHLAAGSAVFVDVTADWCFTCKVNERLVLETEPMATAFDEFGVVAMKADWTNRDDTIASYLASHGRYSVPTYVLYRPGEGPHLFSEVITQEGVIGRLADRFSSVGGN